MKLALLLGKWVISMIATTAISIVVMIYGWGIQPQNFGVIAFGAVAAYIIPLILIRD